MSKMKRGPATRLAVLSGKGGTGKTTVATNLAHVLAEKHSTLYVDFDVEEPDGAIFLKPDVQDTHEVTSPYPVIGPECVPCGVCSAACAYHALARVGGKILVFPELCHGCGACALACPRKAVQEEQRAVGTVRAGACGPSLRWHEGVLAEGESLATTVIRRLRHLAEVGTPRAAQAPVVVADCPPGSSCDVIHAAEGSDLALLVAEPTLFGLHDLAIAIRLMRSLDLPMAIFVNKDDGTGVIDRYAAAEAVPVLGRLPFDPKIARTCAQGDLLDGDRRWVEVFRELGEAVLARVAGGEATT